MAKEPGYVYIHTNESFREDWVKINNHDFASDNIDLSIKATH